MRRVGRIFLGALLVVCPLAPLRAGAQEPVTLTAEESVLLGLQQSPRLRAALGEAAAQHAVFRQVRAGTRPALRAQATYTRLLTDIPGFELELPGADTLFPVLPVERSRYSAELTARQVLFDLRLRNQVRAAEREAEAAGRRAEGEQADQALRVREAYWALYGALQWTAAVDAALAQVEAHLAQVRALVAEEAALLSDVLAVETRRSEVLLERVEAENQVRAWGLELNRRIGLPLDTPVRPVAQVERAPVEAGLAALTAEALASNPDLGALARQTEAADARVAAARGGRLPDVAVLARYVYARPNPYFFGPDQARFRGTLEVGLSSTWGIWEGGRVGAEVDEARAWLGVADARLEEARGEVQVAVARQYLEVRRAEEAEAVSTFRTREAEALLAVARERFAEGAALSAEVLEAERAYRAALAGEAQALADRALAHARLLAALGRVR